MVVQNKRAVHVQYAWVKRLQTCTFTRLVRAAAEYWMAGHDVFYMTNATSSSILCDAAAARATGFVDEDEGGFLITGRTIRSRSCGDLSYHGFSTSLVPHDSPSQQILPALSNKTPETPFLSQT